MAKLPEVERLSASEKDALMAARWAEVQRLNARRSVLEAKPHEPRKEAHHSSVPPSHTPTATLPAAPRTGTRREASGGRAGGGRPLHPDPDHVIMAQAKTCPHGGGAVQAHAQHPHAVYDTIEWPPITPVVTRVEQPAGPCPHGGPSDVAPVPVGMEPGPPCGASSESLALDRRYTPAISDARLSALCTQMCGVPISDGALANRFPRANTRVGDRVAALLTRLRRRRLICRAATGARVNGHTPWEWVCQKTEVCVQVMRSSRGHGVIRDMLGDHRPTIWVAALYSAQRHHPAEDWQVCWAHQLRDGQLALDAGDPVFAPRMKAVLLRVFALHQRRDTLATSTRYQDRCDLQRRLDRCFASQPTNPHGRRLQTRDTKLRDHLCWFLEDASLPPTNNSSEQAIRMSTVFRKVTHGFRADWGRDRFAAVRSVVNTGKRHGLSAFQAIQRALSPVGSLFDPG